MLKVDGFDDCILGVAGGIALVNCTEESILCYSTEKIIEKLMDDMSHEEAIEYFDYNIAGAYMGADTPIFVSDYFDE